MKTSWAFYAFLLVQLVWVEAATANYSHQHGKLKAAETFTLRSYNDSLYLSVTVDECGIDGNRAVEHAVENTPDESKATKWEAVEAEGFMAFQIKNVATNEYLLKRLGTGEENNQVSTFGNFINDDHLYKWIIGRKGLEGGWIFRYDRTAQYLVSDSTGVYLAELDKATEFDMLY